MRRSDRTNDSPNIAKSDALKVDVISHPFSFNSRNRLEAQILEAINLIGGVGEDAEERYQATLGNLRDQVEKVASRLADEYDKLPPEQYLDRWSLVQILAELKPPAALEFLDRVVSSSIPAERSNNPHQFSTVKEEVIIRTTAVEAIARIAKEGHPEASVLLLKQARHEHRSVREAVVLAFLDAGGKGARQQLLKTLPRSDRSLVDLRRVDVREVAQPQGHRHLPRREKDLLPPHRLPERHEEQNRS